MKTYAIGNRPSFKQGDRVKVDLSLICSTLGVREGIIVGFSATTSLLDFWLIDFGEPFSDKYPYHVASIQHTFIVEQEPQTPEDL